MIDLDSQPGGTRAPANRSVQLLPWAILGIVVIALALSLASNMRPVISAIEPDRAAPPTIESEASAGIGSGTEVRRDASGELIAVMDVIRPFAYEQVWCRLIVDSVTIEDTGDDGEPAVCLWVRGAAT